MILALGEGDLLGFMFWYWDLAYVLINRINKDRLMIRNIGIDGFYIECYEEILNV